MTTATPFSLLVVDDEPDLRTLYELTLIREGYDVETAGSVDDALALLAGRRYSAVITDMRLPDGSGLDLLAELRQMPKPPPVLIFSASDYDAGTARHVAASLVKSRTENRELHDTIRHLIESLPPAADSPPAESTAP